MRLCFVTDTFPPDVNGVAHTLYRLRSLLQARGQRVDVIVPGDLLSAGLESGALEPDTAASGLQLAALPIPGYKGLRFGLPSRSQLRTHWKNHRPDIVYIATESPLGFSASEAARDLALPAVSGFHTNFDYYMRDYSVPMLKDLASGYLRSLHNRVAATFAPSPDVITRLRDQGFHNVRLLSRGIDTTQFAPTHRSDALRLSWGADENTLVSLLVGRLAPEKNLALAIRTFNAQAAYALSTGRKFKAILVGDGPKRAELESAHPHIHFAGTRSGHDLACHFASADVFIFPSTSETFGNVVLEAMASGLVTVAYAYAAAQSHIVDGENGLLAPLHDEAAFIAASIRALDQSRWTQWRTQARETTTHLRWEDVAARFEADLLEILGNSP